MSVSREDIVPHAAEQAPVEGDMKSAVSRLIYQTLRGKLVCAWLRFRNRGLFHELQAFSWYLEKDLFTALRAHKQTRLILSASTQACALGEYDHARLLLQEAPTVAAKLSDLGVREFVLDTRLEAGQVVEAMLLILNAAPGLDQPKTIDRAYDGWSARKMAGAMFSPNGYKRFCMRIRWGSALQRIDVQYEYCPLVMSQLLQRQMDRSARYNDHRTFFHLAPRLALLTFLLFLLPEAFHFVGTGPAAIATAVMATVAAVIVGLSLHTMGSIQYDKEHYNGIRESYLQKTRYLSRFPEANPNPILALDSEGQVTYANRAAEEYFDGLKRARGEMGAAVPQEIRNAARHCMDAGDRVTQLEILTGKRHLALNLRAFPDEDAVIVSGTDVTALRENEALLREINEALDLAVQQRTQELEVTRDVTILALASLAEKRDPETGYHLERTRHYVRVLAEHLVGNPRFASDLTKMTIERLFKSAPLHDIGKVGVSDSILLKPGKLTAEEFEAMKMHTIYGGDALRAADEKLGFESFLSMGKEIAYHHHERWDGKGYPHGLAGEAIPWPARLMAVADVYDALTSRRPYKEPWSHVDARDEILRNKGTQFDPDVVDAFIAVEAEIRSIAETYVESESGACSIEQP